ncbi:MAG: hypothetical protein U0353_10800 [Sandaracinus sp.]
MHTSLAHRLTVVALVLVGLATVGCGAAAAAPLDLRAGPREEPLVTLVWVGRGECERYENGTFVRRPELDYELTVTQRRYADRWESVKTMRRLDPAYDGVAGPREQFLGFHLGLAATSPGRAGGAIRSTLGDGRWDADAEIRESVITLHANVSSMAPFDTYRIVQHYRYEEGELEETVELRHGGPEGEIWVRNQEHARLYAVSRFDRAPTIVGAE